MSETAFHAWDAEWADPKQASEEWGRAEADVLRWTTEARLRGARTALDLGCGVGRHALVMARLGMAVTAYDASPRGLAEVRRLADADGLSIETVEGMMSRLPFGDAAFDHVLAWNVIYHGDPSVVRTTIEEIARVLKPGGLYQGTMLSKRRHDFGLGTEVAPDTFVRPEAGGDKSHPHFFCDAADVIALFAGFEVLELKDIDPEGAGEWHWHLVVERLGRAASAPT